MFAAERSDYSGANRSSMLTYAPLLTGRGLKRAYEPTCAGDAVEEYRPPSPTYALYDPSPPPALPLPAPVSLEYPSGFPAYNPLAPTPSETPNSPAVPAVPPVVSSSLAVDRVCFGVRTPEDIVRTSAVEVTTAKVMENGKAVAGGLRDPRFGPSAGNPCATCGATCARPCHGHFGHYPLVEPLYNVHFLKQVQIWLRLVCGACGEVQVDEFPANAKYLGVLAMSTWREKRCRKCQAPLLQSLQWQRAKQVLVTKSGDALPAAEAYRRLAQVKDTHPLLAPRSDGFRLPPPRALLTKVLFVPSVALRPCVGGSLEAGDVPRGENDLTVRLTKIVESNELLRKKKRRHNRDPVSLRAALLGVQEALTGYYDATKTSRQANNDSHQPKHKSLSCLLRGKEGIFRGNLTGKRVDYASRGVIAPSFDGAHPSTVSVPRWMCRAMTVPERCTALNRAYLEGLIRDKRAKYLVRGNGERVNLSLGNPGPLQIGDLVKRELREGDVVLFNRQPTLSKDSCIALRVKEISETLRVFRLPTQLTPTFNADFDGDEMNLHVPQSVEARAECLALLSARNSVLKSSDGNANVVPVQGDRLATYLMTGRCFVSRRQWFFALGRCTDAMVRRAALHPPSSFPVPASRLWSLCLPENYTWSDASGEVRVVRGELVAGRVDKKKLCQLVRCIAVDVSPDAAMDFMHGLNCVAGVFNGHLRTTSICLSEVCPSAELTAACSEVVKRAHAESKRPGADVSACLTRATQGVSALVYAEQQRRRRSGDPCGMHQVVASGAKGSRINSSMMLGALGKMLDAPAPVFTAPEDDPEGERRCFSTAARVDPFMDGFVPTGYSQGMTLQSYVAHAIAGRKSLDESANLVARTGYMFRRISTTLGSLSAVFRGMVMDTAVSPALVVSFRYGDDGASPYACERERLRIPRPVSPTPELDAALHESVRALKDLFPDAETRVFRVPVSVRRVLHAAAYLTPSECEEEKVASLTLEEVAETHAAYAGGPFLRHWLAIALHPYALAGLSPAQARWALSRVDEALWKSRVENGTPVGHLAASGLSAGATQFSLNSFHHIGTGQGGYTALEESINLNKTRRRPLTWFYLRESVPDPAEWVRANKLVLLRHVVMERRAPRPSDQSVLASYWECPDEEGETFVPRMALEVYPDADPLAVRLALDDAGVEHAAYARRKDTGVWVYHTDRIVTTSVLNTTVVSGSIPDCRLGDKERLVLCSRLPDVLSFFDDVDMLRYCTNNFHETCARLGIEAARATMVRELVDAFKTFGVNMQRRHLELLADRVSSSGVLLGCTRHGLAKRNPDRVLHASAYEQHTQVLSVAAAAGSVDELKGPEENQIMGQTPRIGTHSRWLDVVPDPNAEVAPSAVNTVAPMEVEDDLDFAQGWGDSWYRPKQSEVAEVAAPYVAPAPSPYTKQLQHDPWSAFYQ